MDRLQHHYPLLSSGELSDAAQAFASELSHAAQGRASSLPYILNPVNRNVPKSGFGVTVSIGGTNGYVSAFRISDQKTVKFLNRIFFPLPVKSTKEALFALIAEHIFQASGQRKQPFPIGIGFAYPLKPLLHHGYIDGELLSMSKEREIHGLVGKRVGQEFHRYLIDRYSFDTTVAIANDAICLLLGGNGSDLAGVLGTGLNFAYWEKREQISEKKLKELEGFFHDEVAINIESAEFNKFPISELCRRVDSLSDATKGSAMAEKESAGAFLYQIFNAGKDEILGEDFPPLSSTDQINDILTGAYPYDRELTNMQRQVALQYAQQIFQRSAQHLSIQICGILLKLGKTKGIVPIVMEGGIFWKAKNYHTMVNAYLNEILPDVIPSFARLFGSSRRGMAVLAMSGNIHK